MTVDEIGAVADASLPKEQEVQVRDGEETALFVFSVALGQRKTMNETRVWDKDAGQKSRRGERGRERYEEREAKLVDGGKEAGGLASQ